MSKVAINETTLTNIGDAIREKTGKTDLIAPGDMPAEIASISTGGGGIEVEPIVLTGNCSYGCSGPLSSKFIELFGDKITTNKLTYINYMFKGSKVTNIPFELNMENTGSYSCDGLFSGAGKLEKPPIMNNFHPSNLSSMFENCGRLRIIPENVFNNWNYYDLHDGSWANINYIFYNCYSLRNIPERFLKNIYTKGNYSSGSLLYCGFFNCYSLDEIRGININPNVNITSDVCSNAFNNCGRVKDIIFDCNENGSPKAITVTKQTINLADNNYIGYSSNKTRILGYNSGITADKQVTDDATYQALKDDPDWWTTDIAYSRYNHDSAVRTINSLPDTSAYLASAGGTNTIKFKGAAGSKTDGGAINTLTEEEIAVATAKGWTVTLV